MSFLKKFIPVYILIICSYTSVYAQNALVMLKFEEAEKAFNNGSYQEVLQLLDEVEEQAGVSSKTLYLRIVAENKLLADGQRLYESEKQYTRLQNVRKNTAAYLKAMEKLGLDDKYREVYRISEDLSRYPSSRPEWQKERDAYLVREQNRKQEVEQKRQALQLAENKARELTAYKAGSLNAADLKYNAVAAPATENDTATCTVILYKTKSDFYDKLGTYLFFNDEYAGFIFKKYIKVNVTPGILKINGFYYKGFSGLANYFKTHTMSDELRGKYNTNSIFLDLNKNSVIYVEISQARNNEQVFFKLSDHNNAVNYIAIKGIEEGKFEDFPKSPFK